MRRYMVLLAVIALGAMTAWGQTVHFETANGPTTQFDSSLGEVLFQVVVHDANVPAATTTLVNALTVRVVDPLGGASAARNHGAAPATLDRIGPINLTRVAPGVFHSSWLTLQELGNLTAPGTILSLVDTILEVFPGDVIEAEYTGTTANLYSATACVLPRIEFTGAAGNAGAVPYGGNLQNMIRVYDWSANAAPGAADTPTIHINGVAVGLTEVNALGNAADDSGFFRPAAARNVAGQAPAGYYLRPGDAIELLYQGACASVADVWTVSTRAVELWQWVAADGEYLFQSGYDLVSGAIVQANAAAPPAGRHNWIRVHEGTYNETAQWDINQRVEIEPFAAGGDPGDHVIQFTFAPAAHDVELQLNSDSSRIRRLTLRFDGATGTRGGGGIRVVDNASNVTITECVIYVGDSSDPGAVAVPCWALRSANQGKPHGLQFTDNTVYSVGTLSGGVWIDDPDAALNAPVVIEDNTFHGNFLTGIHIDHADATIEGNTLTTVNQDGNRRAPSDRVGTGIQIQMLTGTTNGTTAVTVRDNTVDGFQRGLWLDKTVASQSRFIDPTVECNVLQHNYYGAWIGPAQWNAGLGSVWVNAGTFHFNTMIGNQTGLYWTNSGGALPVDSNNYEGNVNYGLVNGTDNTLLNASLSWWGHASGPQPAGSGDKVTSNLVTVAPWMQQPLGCEDPSVPGAPGFPAVAVGNVQMVKNATQGAIVRVVNIPAPGLADLQGRVTYNENMFEVVGTPVLLAEGYELTVNTSTAGEVRFGINQAVATGHIVGSADVLRITFRAIGDPGDQSPLEMLVEVLRRPDGTNIGHTPINGLARILRGTTPGTASDLGDVNLDGTIDITDARLAAEHAIKVIDLEIANPPRWPAGAFERADVNKDGKVDASDARMIAEYAVGLIDTFSYPTVGPRRAYGTASVAITSYREMAVSSSNAQLADVQGTLYFDPSKGRITEVVGLNGFQVLAASIDNIAGRVRFVAAKLSGGGMENGEVVEFKTANRLTDAVLVLDVLRDPQGQDIPHTTVQGGSPGQVLEFGCSPNPVQDVNTTYFSVKATSPVQEIRVYIYDFSGRLVYDSGWGPNDLAWHLQNNAGDVLANGVYYYRIEVMLLGASKPVVTGMGKVAVYR